MARRRRRNPDLLKNVLIGAGGFVLGALVATAARASKSNELENGKDVYYYWAAFKDDGNREVYTPMIQNARTHETFALPDEWMQASAESAAEQEIRKRGGIPQLGQPQA